MRNLKRQITAVLTAAFMTFSAAAGTVSAQEGQQEEASKYTGWVTSGDGWKYLENGEPCNWDPHKIDGVMCDFSLYGYYIGGYSGWEKDRCYKEGLPFTGWTDNRRLREMREEYYCIDGYKVTGDFPVGDKIYSFTKTGKYTGKSRNAEVIVFCGEKISADTEKIKFTIENLNDESRSFKIAKSFEYFKDGKWESCKNGKVSYSPIDKELSKKGEMLSFEADVREYSSKKLNEGFYRLPIICGEETYYAVFETVSPIELKSQKDDYVFANNVKTSGGTIKLDMTINSDKKDMQAESIANNISVKLEKQTENGWSEVTDFPCEIGYGDDDNRLEIAPEFIPEVGYYRVTATVGKNNYTDTFRVRNHMVTAWLDEYDLNSKDLTISFTVINCDNEPIKVCTFPYGLYQKNPDGTWRTSYVEGAAVEISSDAYKTLSNRESTAVNFDISNYYNMSELTVGDYAVDIGGIGLAEFTLTDKPAEKDLPFKDLKAEDVKEIKIVKDYCGADKETLVLNSENREYFNRSINYLRQFELKEKYKNYEIPIGGVFILTLTLKDETEKTFYFHMPEAVMLSDRKAYYCTEYFSSAFMEFLSELAEYVQYESHYEDDVDYPDLEEDTTPFRTDT
ncbi:MAG: hypothetical protein K2K44_00750 [Oscillospiraceae bacterium]|nr:hypothetical protein [Oscillospiraceae bacterium]